MRYIVDFFSVLLYPISMVLSYKLFSYLKKITYIFYTAWIKREFKSMNGFIKYPIYLTGGKYMTIGKNTIIGKRVTLQCWNKYEGEKFNPQFHIGDNCSIRDDSHITCANYIYIGNNVRIGPKVLITDNSHGASTRSLLDINPIKRPLYSKGPIFIGDNVWIGEKSSIMPNVKIRKGVIIGANSVVTKDIPDYAIVAGSPAKIIKQL